MLLLTIAALVRLRRTRQSPTPFRARGNLRVGGRELPLDCSRPAAIVAVSALAMILTGEAAAIAAGGAHHGVVAVVHDRGPASRNQSRSDADEDTFDLLLAAELSPDQIEARPGNVLVPVRNPHPLAHVVAALQTSGDRDVVVMTARLLDVDVSEESAGADHADAVRAAPALRRRRLAERVGRPVRLLIVPTRNVFDAIVGDGHPPALVGRVRRRIGHAVGRGSSPSAGRSLGAGRQT